MGVVAIQRAFKNAEQKALIIIRQRVLIEYNDRRADVNTKRLLLLLPFCRSRKTFASLGGSSLYRN